MQVFSAIVNDGEAFRSDPSRKYRDTGHGPLLEIFEVLRTASGNQPGAYIGSCYARTLIDHRELAHANGVKIGSAYLPPKVAVALADSVAATVKGPSAPDVSRLDERIRRFENANAREQSPRLRKTLDKTLNPPQIETRAMKVGKTMSAIAAKIPDATKAIGKICEEITSAGIRVSGPRF